MDDSPYLKRDALQRQPKSIHDYLCVQNNHGSDVDEQLCTCSANVLQPDEVIYEFWKHTTYIIIIGKYGFVSEREIG